MNELTKGRVADGEPKAWVRLADPAELRAHMENHPYNFGFVPAMGRLLKAHARLAPHFMKLFAEVMFSPESVLSRAEREMVAAAAAAAQNCFY